jgi:hypothetical protein
MQLGYFSHPLFAMRRQASEEAKAKYCDNEAHQYFLIRVDRAVNAWPISAVYAEIVQPGEEEPKTEAGPWPDWLSSSG